MSSSVDPRTEPNLARVRTEEQELIARSGGGDEIAFERLVERYQGSLTAYLLRFVSDRTAGEDLLQETLIRLWRALPGYEERGRFESWLFQIARNVARDEGRKQSRRPRVEYLEIVPEPARETGLAEEHEARELEEAISMAIAGLPEKQRHVFLLRLHTDLRFREIAEIMGEPLNTVLGHMHKAMTKLRGAVPLENDV